MEIVATLTITRGEKIDRDQGRNSLGVYKAIDPQLGQVVALKEISKADRDVDSYFSEAQRMFDSEHPNVVQILRASQTPDTILLLMPLFGKGSLQTRIEERPLSIGETIRIGREILAGVGAIHAGGSVHLDIKPSNVLFADNGDAKVSDFGQARALGPDGFAILPNRMYAPIVPPEAFSQTHVDRLADIYQVGLTLYRAVNGEEFFDKQLQKFREPDARRAAIERGKFPDRTSFLPHVPDRLRRVLRTAMRPDASKRYQSAIDFANALTRILPTLDWSIRFHDDGSVHWDAPRRGRPDLYWVMRPDGTAFKAEFYTRKNGKLRATKKGIWKGDFTRQAASDYFNLLFEAVA